MSEFGWKKTSIFFSTSALVSWTFEGIGVSTGFIYGSHFYTDLRGAKLKNVPISINYMIPRFPESVDALRIVTFFTMTFVGTLR